MADTPARRVVVVDGSNLATEGRTAPSLRQLDEAVRAYAQEDPEAEIVVVVDASFEHRIDASEREQLVDAELHGELVSPPAGAIGRGDAFVLRIAERTGASVLSNDSFQEFHAQHPWLFDQGRLVGGKPVPGVGWIFTPRLPVRGPKSKEVTGRARRAASALEPPEKAAELAKAAKKAAQRAEKAAARRVPTVLPDGTVPKVGDVWRPGAPASAEPADAAASDGVAASTRSGRRARSDKRVARSDNKAAPPLADGAEAAVAGARAPRRRTRGAGAEDPARAPAAPATPAPTSPAAPKGRKARREEAEVAAPPARGSRRARRGAEPAETPSAKPPSRRSRTKSDETQVAPPAPAKKGVAKAAAATPAAAATKARAKKAPTSKEAGPGRPSKEAGPGRPTKKERPSAAPAKKAPRAGTRAAGAHVAEEQADKAPAPASRAKSAKATAQVEPAPSRGTKAEGAAGRASAKRRAGRSRGEEGQPLAPAGRARDDPAVRRAIDDALAEVSSPGDAGADEGRRAPARGGRARTDGAAASSEAGAGRRRRAAPPPAVNEPLAFITFVAAHPLHTDVEGEVVSFTSHGAMVDVDLPGGGTLHCYIPLSAMGEPPPTKAREVLTRGERRRFVLVGLDPPRRVAELALPGAAVPAPPG